MPHNQPSSRRCALTDDREVHLQSDALEQLEPVHVRHVDVAEDQVEPPLPLAKHGERRRRARTCSHCNTTNQHESFVNAHRRQVSVRWRATEERSTEYKGRGWGARGGGGLWGREGKGFNRRRQIRGQMVPS